MKLTTAQIGRLGELLVQSRLLEIGIDSAPTTTDTGIDLLALAPNGAVAIQVKTNMTPKPAGGRGILWVDWWVPKDTDKKTLLAFVRYDEKKVWLMNMEEISRLAQQGQSKTAKKYHFGMAVENSRNGKPHKHDQMQYIEHLFENKRRILFG